MEYVIDVPRTDRRGPAPKPIKYCIDSNGCWNCFSHGRHTFGYPQMRYRGKMILVMKYLWMQEHGCLDHGLVMRHTCDNPNCINLDHIIIGSRYDNVRDMVDRNRQAIGESVWSSKLCEKDIVVIRELHRSGLSSPKIAEKYNVHKSTILRVINGKTWSHVG